MKKNSSNMFYKQIYRLLGIYEFQDFNSLKDVRLINYLIIDSMGSALSIINEAKYLALVFDS